MNCIICNSPPIITIPTLTKSFSFCTICLTQPIPSHIQIELIREITTDTLSFILSTLSESQNLKSQISSLNTKITEIESATKYGLLESTQKDRDSLLEENDKLNTELHSKISQLTILQEENDKLNKSLSVSNDLSDHITNNADRIIALIKKQNSSFNAIISQLNDIQEQQTEYFTEEEPIPVEPIKSSPKREKGEIPIEELQD